MPPAPAADGPPTLDERVLEGLRALGGPDDPTFFSDLVAQFVQHADGALPALRAAAAKGDARGVETLAHGLKGSSGNMGAMRMHRLCGDLQGMGTAGGLGRAAPSIDALEAEYALVRARLLAAAGGDGSPPADRC
jgi:HPt (histidine-containing phosphotransfer) domain-containing protein